MECQVIVYTAPGCQPCAMLKRWLDKAGVQYEERSTTDEGWAAEARRYGRTLPVTWCGGIVVHGFQPSVLAGVLK